MHRALPALFKVGLSATNALIFNLHYVATLFRSLYPSNFVGQLGQNDIVSSMSVTHEFIPYFLLPILPLCHVFVCKQNCSVWIAALPGKSNSSSSQISTPIHFFASWRKQGIECIYGIKIKFKLCIQNYPPNTDCQFMLKASSANHRIHIKIIESELEEALFAECNDYIIIWDGDGSYLLKINMKYLYFFS